MERLVPNPCIPNFDFFDKINIKIMKYLQCPNGDIGDTSLLYRSARSPTKVTSMAPLMASSLTVLVVQQGKTDGHCPAEEAHEGPQAVQLAVDAGLDAGDALARGDVNVDAGGDSEDDTDSLGRNVVGGQDGDAAQQDCQARDEVQDQGPADRETSLFGQKEEVGELLRYLMVEGDEEDGERDRTVAEEEADADEDTVAKVVEGVPDEDGRAEAVVDIPGLSLACVCVGRGGLLGDLVRGLGIVLDLGLGRFRGLRAGKEGGHGHRDEESAQERASEPPLGSLGPVVVMALVVVLKGPVAMARV